VSRGDRKAASLAAAFLAAGALAAAEAPEKVVRDFFKACDRRNADAAAALVAADAPVGNLGDEKPSGRGRDAVQALLAARWREHPEARTKLVDTVALGGWVAALEARSLEPGEPPKRLLTLFSVADGAIRRVWELPAESDEPGGLSGEGAAGLAVEKWNDRDVPRLLALYEETASIYELPLPDPVASGEDALRDRFEKTFEAGGRARLEVTRRLAVGPWVVYLERGVLDPDGKPAEALAIYQVRDGRIRRVWLAR
jgi:hypothetical protein